MARHHFGADAKAMATFGARGPKRSQRRGNPCQEEDGEAVVTTVVEEVIVDRSEEGARCEGRAPKRVCRAKKMPERGRLVARRRRTRLDSKKPGCALNVGTGVAPPARPVGEKVAARPQHQESRSPVAPRGSRSELGDGWRGS